MKRIYIMIFALASIANAGIYLKYQNPWNTSQTLNVVGVKVCILQLNGTLVATTAASNSNGYIDTKNLNLATGQYYIVAALAQNNAGSIHMGTSCAGDLLSFVMGLGYPAFDPVKKLFGSTIKSTNTTFNLNGYMVRAMDMLAITRTIAVNDFGYSPPTIKIWWNPCTVVNEAWPRFYSIDETNFFSELASNIFGQRIELHEEFATSEQWFFCTIAHEFGHFIQYKIYGNYLPDGDGPDPHYIDSESSPEFALTEGWAIFFGDYVLSRNGFSGSFNLENFCLNYGITTRPTEQEGRVAGFFWDIVDNTPAEIGDLVTEPANRITEIFRNYRPNNIADFLSDWQNAYGNSIDDLYAMTFEWQSVGIEHHGLSIARYHKMMRNY